jgi:hypothetical protein
MCERKSPCSSKRTLALGCGFVAKIARDRYCAGFSDAAARTPARHADRRRRRSAKARSRGILGTRVQRALWRFDLSAGVDGWLAVATDVDPNAISARIRARGTPR